MLYWALVFLIVALVAAALGFGGNAEFCVFPRRRSSAKLSALSFFGSGGT